MKRALNRTLDGISLQADELQQLSSTFEELSEKQLLLANGLKPNLLKQSKQSFKLTMKILSDKNLFRKVSRAARIPGKIFVIILKKKKEVDMNIVKSINQNIQEKIKVLDWSVEDNDIIKMIFDKNRYSITRHGKYLLIQCYDFNMDIKNKVRITEQLIGTYIEINENKEIEYV